MSACGHTIIKLGLLYQDTTTILLYFQGGRFYWQFSGIKQNLFKIVMLACSVPFFPSGTISVEGKIQLVLIPAFDHLLAWSFISALRGDTIRAM